MPINNRITNPTILASSQFVAPFDILPNIVLTRQNPTINPPKKYDNPTPNADYVMNVQNTNIQIADTGKRTAATLALSAASFLGVPQLAQIPNGLLDTSNKNSIYREYSTSPLNQLNDIPGIKYQDFRLRKGTFSFKSAGAVVEGLVSRRLDGTAAATRKSPTAAIYAGLAATIGAYSTFNRDGVGTFGYGWGDHDNPYAIRNDFTLSSHVSTTWVRTTEAEYTTIYDSLSKTIKQAETKKQKPGRWVPTKNPIELAVPFRGDRVSVIDFGQRSYSEAYLWKPAYFKGDKWLGSTLNKSGVTQDFIKFLITGPKISPSKLTERTVEDDIFAFRACNLTVDDSFQASYTTVNMIGRADPNYQYNSFSRDLSISFTVYATDRDELKPIWRKLNYLASYTAPIYDAGQLGLTAPWVRFTLGDLFIQQPALISSVSYTLIDSETPIEINIEKDPQMMQVPHGVKVTLAMYMIGDSLPQKGGRMYTLAKSFDKNDVPREGNDNWLSDAKNTAPATEKLSTIRQNNQGSGGFIEEEVLSEPTVQSVPNGGTNDNLALQPLPTRPIVMPSDLSIPG
jgi:hypothetical protein